ncbi:hypothetical protein WJX72_006896 [[Myrmecia] bisecta]|uniref:NB-ARC domain-containing protein n=1 Tax=[Myrmecia] bisecta TaxID=41462 RepID=A0AAW1PGK7_9CHLO
MGVSVDVQVFNLCQQSRRCNKVVNKATTTISQASQLSMLIASHPPIQDEQVGVNAHVKQLAPPALYFRLVAVVSRLYVVRWQAALQKVSTVTGWWHNPTTESLTDLVNRVTINLEGSLEAKPRDRDGGKIGIQDRVDELLKRWELQTTGGVRLLGLTGMGGVGKTTLATALYDRLKGDFVSAACYVADIRARTSQPKGIQEVQQQMLEKLCNSAGLPYDKVEGKNELLDKLQGRRILLVLDDIGVHDWNLLPPKDDESNFLALSVLRPDSIVIITSREAGLLERAGCTLEPIEFLTPQQSRLLFEQHVGLIKVPAKTVDNVVSKCADLPLTLKVLAGHLKAKQERFWDEATTKLTMAEEFPDQQGRLFERLRISYEDLNDRQKTLFVDISCLLAAGSRFHRRMMRDTDEQIFVYKHLLTVDFHRYPDYIDMHDQLRDLGVSVERGAVLRTRLWGDDAARHIPGLTKESPSATLPGTCLAALRILVCSQVEDLPDLGQLTSLQTLDLSRMCKLEALPESLGKLTSLTLYIFGCRVPKEFLARLKRC